MANEDDKILQVFNRTGLLSEHFRGYEPRVGQVELAMAVDDAMTAGQNLIAEAPTGTGKSIGYGVPATIAASKGERVVIVTANIALQEQLIRKDLPLLEKVVPWKFTYAIAKGLNNYLCKDAFFDASNTIVVEGFKGNATERKQWDQIVRWATTTATGDVSELPFEPLPSLRPKFTIMSEDCIGKKCASYADCPAIKARAAAKKASIVVTNYSLFFADLVIKRGGSDGVLPKYAHVVFDEGHQAADHARGFLGFRVSRGGLMHAIKLLNYPQSEKSKKGPMPVVDPDLRDTTTRVIDDLFASLTQLFHSKKYAIRFQRQWETPLFKQAEEVSALLHQCAERLLEVVGKGGLGDERILEIQNCAAKCGDHAANILRCARYEVKDWVYFLEEEKDQVVLKGTPVSVAEYLRTNLFEMKTGPNAVKSVTVTSATLATSVDDYDYISDQLGLRDCEKLTVESPFDIRNNTLIVCPPMPEPSHEDFIDSVAESIREVIKLAKGRTLCLFTSYRVLDKAYELVANGRQKLPYPLLRQGTAPRTQLIEQFKNDVSSVLFGTESFWAGVDVPGESLSVVVMDKLPFPNFGDPLQDFLKVRLGKAYFNDCSVPAAVLAYRQGCGRLLRTVTDRGVIVLLDCRVTTKGYGKKFIRAFPQGTQVSRNLADIAEFLVR